MSMDDFDIRFADVRHGWLTVTISLNENETVIDVSDVPDDPIASLVSLARFLVSSAGGTREVGFHLESSWQFLSASAKANSATTTQSASHTRMH